jgi:hypothetical protein
MRKTCRNCQYYHGQHEIHCGLYPFGRPDRDCPDWKRLTWQMKAEKGWKTVRTLTKKQKSILFINLTFPVIFYSPLLLFGPPFSLIFVLELMRNAYAVTTFLYLLLATFCMYLKIHWHPMFAIYLLGNLCQAIAFSCLAIVMR